MVNMVIIAYQQRRPSMNTQTNPLNFELELLPQLKIERPWVHASKSAII